MELLLIVRSQIEERFAAEDAREVVSELERSAIVVGGSSDAWREYELARVQLAILAYARGDITRFRQALTTARADFRDALMMAGLGDDDWAAKLARAGFRVPPEPAKLARVEGPSRGPWGGETGGGC